MSSPNPPHTVAVEGFVDGVWTAFTGDVYQRSDLVITRGASSESGDIQPGALSGVVLDERVPKYSPGNPTASLYGKFTRGMPLRVSAGGSIRGIGELRDPTPRQDRSGRDLHVEASATGLLHRLGLGQDPLTSPPRVYLPTTGAAGGQPIIAYWPMEDGPLSTQGEALAGPSPMVPATPVPQGWGEGELAAWLPPTVAGRTQSQLNNDAIFLGRVTTGTATGRYAIDYMVRGAASHALTLSPDALSPGSNTSWTLSFTESISGLQVSPPTGGSGSVSAPHTRIFDGQPHHVRFVLEADGATGTNWSIHIDGVLERSGNDAAIGPGVPQWVMFNATNQGVTGTRASVVFGHVALYYHTAAFALPSLATAVNVAFGRAGEAAGDRITRVAAEAGVSVSFVGTAAATRPCGPQPVGTALEVMRDAAKADGGILREARDTLALVYHTRSALYGQAAALALTYTTNHHLGAQLAPAYDDQVLRNDVTITRALGGASRVQRTSGPLSTAAHPAGVGRYKDTDTISVLFQEHALDHAGARVLIGTWTDARHPVIRLDLNTLPLAQRAEALLVDPGERVTIASPPAWLGPDTIDLLVTGVRERVNRYAWDLDLSCVPYGPLLGAVEGVARYSTNGSTLAAAATSTASSLSVATPAGPLWATAGATPFDIRVAGERITVTAISGASSPQTLTVTRSVNGVIKAQAAGAVVELWTPAYWEV